MNSRNLIGVVLCAGIFGASFLTVDGAGYFVNGLGLLIVISGTLGACLLSYPWTNFRAALRVGWNSYASASPTDDEIVDALIKASVHSRYDGFLALEKLERQTTVSFLKGALELVVDGYRPGEIREVLTNELAYFRQRRLLHERVFRHMARLAPAFGVAGSVIGLMSMLFGIGDTAVILRTIPLALTSTLYGIVIANFLLTPVAENIHAKTMQEALTKQLVIEGVAAILSEQNPHKLEKRLESFLTPAARGDRRRSLREIRRRYAEMQSEQTAETG